MAVEISLQDARGEQSHSMNYSADKKYHGGSSVITRQSVSPSGLGRSAIGALLLLLSIPSFADTELLKEARDLLERDQATQAYRLLDGEAGQYAGEPEYDYLLGLAALRAGEAEQALFALERVVQTQPGHAAARMELVSAYMQLGMNAQAQQQLAILETQNPPEAAAEAMSRYQEILRPRLSGTPDPVRLLGLSVGYDDNVGSFPDMDLGFLGLAVEPEASPYHQLRGTIQEPVRLDEKRRLDVTLHGQLRRHTSAETHQFDLGLVHLGFLLNTTVDAVNKYALGIQGDKLWLGGSGFRDNIGVGAYWQRRLDAELNGQLGLRLNRYTFDPDTHDYDHAVLSGELERRWTPKLRTAFELNFESESARGGRSGGDANRYGLGVKLDYRVSPRSRIDTRLVWAQTDYDESYQPGLYNPTSKAQDRIDKTLDLGLGWRFSADRYWQFDADVTYRDQDSTVKFYDTDRWTAQMGLVRYF